MEGGRAYQSPCPCCLYDHSRAIMPTSKQCGPVSGESAQDALIVGTISDDS